MKGKYLVNIRIALIKRERIYPLEYAYTYKHLSKSQISGCAFCLSVGSCTSHTIGGLSDVDFVRYIWHSLHYIYSTFYKLSESGSPQSYTTV